MSSHDKYRLFMNFMHNELQITKDDIKLWIKESVQEVATKMVAQEFEKYSVHEVVKSILFKNGYFGKLNLQDEARKELANILADKIELKVKT